MNFNFASIAILNLSLLCTLGVGAQDIILENGRFIIGDGTVVENGSMRIRDGVIDDIFVEKIATDSSTTIIDIAGKTVIPALIDAHAHLGYQSAVGWGAEQYTLENLQANLEQYAYFGFSAVFSAGSDDPVWAQSVASATSTLESPKARLLFAAGVGPKGQGPNDRFLQEIYTIEESTQRPILHWASNSVDAISVARSIARQETSFVKIWVDDRGGSQEKLSPDVYKPLIAEAQRLRLKTFVHQQNLIDMFDLVESGAAGFLHGRLEQEFTLELAKLLKTNGVFVVPNLGLSELRSKRIDNDPFLQPILSTALRNEMANRFGAVSSSTPVNPEREAIVRASLALLLTEQVDIVLGTDAGAIPNHPFGYTGHKELEIYVRLGMTPMQAIISATSAAARHLELHDLGLLQEGYSADLVILNKNPLDSISNTQSIHRVFLKGEPIDRNQIAVKISASNN